MNSKISEINELDFEKLIAVIFIFLSIMNIYGETIQQKYLRTNNISYEKQARNIFVVVIIISIIAYLYFVYRNYRDLKSAINQNKNIFAYNIRFFGSILIVIGFLCILYFQENSSLPVGGPPV